VWNKDVKDDFRKRMENIVIGQEGVDTEREKLGVVK